MRRSRVASIVALGAAATLMLAACGGGGGTSPDSGGAAAGGGTFSVAINSDPENPLIPGNTTESEGNQILKALFTPLVNYNLETTEVEYTGVAESIESEDNTTWTVTLKDGWTFHDGTPVTASSFVDAWNYNANVANAFGASYFFSNIAGYDGENPVEAMSGLAVVDDSTFTVTLATPFAQFPLTVGYMAFSPLPEAFFADPAAFGEQPIGNGPFRADGPFVPGQGLTVSRFAEYAGDDQPVADSIEFRIITDINTAYNELLGGNVDVIRPSIPPELIPTAQAELGERFIEREAAGFDYMGFPTYDPRFADKRVRQAFSMAVDRAAITEAIFSGARTPATDVIPPVIDGHRADACQYCVYDPARAQALLAESGFDTSQPVELWFNSGAGHDAWVQAVGNQLQQNLGITYSLRGDLDFAQYLPLQDEQGMTGPFRLGWGMDYPSPQNFLEPLFSTSALPPAGSNTSFYSNPEFDRLVTEGNQASSNEEAIALYQQADDLLLEDMPVMPMFFRFTQGARSENVENVQFDAFQDVALTLVQPVNG
ncbi:MAG: ABC transporter substrate-binding protein [Pseudonocardiales bacterium]|jgi:oligopeptide transport system substrate-binding protein|nr:ABC transporter substrate-binding protein [Pseudonocardiales bacterium]